MSGFAGGVLIHVAAGTPGGSAQAKCPLSFKNDNFTRPSSLFLVEAFHYLSLSASFFPFGA